MVALVDSWSGGMVRPAAGQFGLPGPACQSATSAIANTGDPGNWMVVLCVWRITSALDTTIAVGDDAENLWEPLGAPNGTSTATGLTRCSIWAAASPRPAANIYVAPNGYTGGISFLAVELSGLSPWQTLAGIITGYAGAATALSLALPAPSAQALFLTCAGGDLNTGTVSGPGAGWTALPSVSFTNGSDYTSDTFLESAWQVSSAAVTAAWSDTVANDLSGVLAGVLVTGTAPAAPAQNWPLIRFQAGFGAGAATPWDTVTWTDLTSRYQGMSGQSGKQYELDTIQAGTTTWTLSNNDATLTPGNQNSAYWLGVAGWSVTAGTGTLAPSQQYSWLGMATAVYTPDGVTSGGHPESSRTAVITGDTYSGSVWAYSPQGWSTCAAFISWYNSGGSLLSTSTGASASLSADQWTQFTVSGTAPASAVYGTIGFITNGTPPVSTRFWLAAAMLLSPAGAILNSNWNFSQGAQAYTPVRLLVTWPPPPALNARTYVIKREFMERWPQALTPARYQIANAVSTDAWALLTPLLLTLPRAEILQDGPSAYWPLDDLTGSVTGRQIAPTSVGPIQVVASRNGTSTAAVTFGVSADALAGDPSATGWQQSALPASDTEGYSLYTADQLLPPLADGITITGWFNMLASQPTGANLGLITVRNGKGTVAEVFVTQSTGDIKMIVFDKITGTGTTTTITTLPALTGNWFHVALELTPASWQVYINAGQTASGSGTANLASTSYWLCFDGIADRSYGGSFFNGILASLVVFPVLLPVSRLQSHWFAFIDGASSDPAGYRIERLLGAGLCAFPRLIAQNGDEMTGALDISGQAVSQNVANIAESDSGILLVNSAGYLVYQYRQNAWNLPVQQVLGEQVASQLNVNSNFNTGVSPWTGGNSATVAVSSAWAYSGLFSLVMNGNGSTANPGALSEQTIPVTAGTAYTASAWVYSPQGWSAVQVCIDWYNSSHTYLGGVFPSPSSLPAGGMTQLTASGQAPASAAYAEIIIQMAGTPASTVQLFIDMAELTTSYTEQPYLADATFDYDPSQVFNDLTLDQLAAPAYLQWSFTASTTSSEFFAVGFSFSDGQQVLLSGTSLPGGFTAGVIYYVINVSANSFQLSATSGGTAITVTSDGSGTVAGFSPATGVTITLASPASIAAYGDQTLQQTVYQLNPVTITDLANWIVNTLGTPGIRIDQLTLDPSANPLLWPVVLALQTSQVVLAKRRLGSGTESPPEIDLQQQIMSVAHSNQPGVWRTTIGGVPYYGQILTLDDPVLGVLDGNNRLGW